MSLRSKAAALVGLAAIAVGVAVVIGGSGSEQPAAATAETDVSRADDTLSTAPGSAPPRRPTTLRLETPEGAYPAIWVRRGKRVEIRTEPGGGELVETAGKRTEFGSPAVFSVIRHSGDWAAVTTAALPNGRLGWVKLDPRRLRAGWTKVSIVVDLSDRRLAIYEDEELVRSFSVTVGMPGAETPTGRFAVTDSFRGDLNPVYGCCALALSATQPNLPSGWLGGRRIAIHGTSGPLGIAASHGCVRAADEDVSALVRRVALGTPVFIRG